jgi:hypothetical protein
VTQAKGHRRQMSQWRVDSWHCMVDHVWINDRMARVVTMEAGNKIGNVVVGVVMWQWEIVLGELKISLFVTKNEGCFGAITKLGGI